MSDHTRCMCGGDEFTDIVGVGRKCDYCGWFVERWDTVSREAHEAALAAERAKVDAVVEAAAMAIASIESEVSKFGEDERRFLGGGGEYDWNTTSMTIHLRHLVPLRAALNAAMTEDYVVRAAYEALGSVEYLAALAGVVKNADEMAEAFDVIKCNLDPVDSCCDDPCHLCSLMKAHKARDAYIAAHDNAERVIRGEQDS